MVIAAVLDNVRNGFAIDLQIGGEVPAEIRDPDHNETATLGTGGVGCRDRKEKDKNQNKFADVAGQGPHEFVVTRLASHPHALNAPERAVRAELGDFPGGTSADVNGDRNDTDKRAHENHGHHPRRDVPDAQGVIERYDIVDRCGGVQKDFCHPRDQDQDENEYVIPFHPPPNCFQFRDLEAGQN